MNATSVITRFAGNPIVLPQAVPRAHAISNSAVVRFGSGYAGLFRVDHTDRKHKLHAGRSHDGIVWDIEPQPIKLRSDNPDIMVSEYTFDPRITPLDGRYYIVFCDPGKRGGPYIAMAHTEDFVHFALMENPLPPCNRNAVLFPRKIDGKYAMLHRPSDKTHTAFGEIIYSASPDLVHWGCHRFVMGPSANWESTKVGPGPVPIETPDGWLLIYHGVWTSCNGMIYSAGAALLDLEQPWRVLYRAKDYLLAPAELYERVGDVPNVVFPTAAILDDTGSRLRLYYGCADTCIGMAEAELGDLIAWVKERS